MPKDGGGYRIALAYSNTIRKDKGLPVIVSGIITTDRLYLELEKQSLPSKNTLKERVNRFFDMHIAFHDLCDYLTSHDISRIYAYQKLSTAIEEAYLLLIRKLMKGHLQLLDGKVNSITVRGIEDYDPGTNRMVKVEFSYNFTKKLAQYVNKNQFLIKGKDDYERLLEVARILATLEYYREVAKDGSYFINEIQKSPSRHFQILKLRWNSPPIEEFDNYNVGPPSLVVRLPNRKVQDVYIEPGIHLSFSPLDKFCRGTQSYKALVPCKKSSKENPFGSVMTGSSGEYCRFCRKTDGFDPSLCLFRVPLCNGSEAKCGNHEFAGNVCCGLFGAYVTRFGSKLKVGTAILSNIIGRLLEQGPSHALVIRPFRGILNIHEIESALQAFLESRVSELSSYGISDVSIKSLPYDDTLAYFLNEEGHTDNSALLLRVKDMLKDFEILIDNQRVKFHHARMTVFDFRNNYLDPPNALKNRYLRSEKIEKAEGIVNGYRGSLVFLSSGRVVSLKALGGYVVRGKITC